MLSSGSRTKKADLSRFLSLRPCYLLFRLRFISKVKVDRSKVKVDRSKVKVDRSKVKS